jgi:hypothetical protein
MSDMGGVEFIPDFDPENDNKWIQICKLQMYALPIE